MYEFEKLLPFIAAAYAMWATPGPNNMMLAHSGARFGVRGTLPHLSGVVFGNTLLNMAGLLALEPIIRNWPQTLLVLRIIGSFWLLWFGWKMAMASRNVKASNKERPMSFFSAAAFQFANPKAVSATSALASLVLVQTNDSPWLLSVVLVIIPMICVSANGPWALAGQSFRRFLSTRFRWRIFSWAAGALTAGCALFLWV